MPKNEKIGSDGYSKVAFQAGLDGLDKSQIAYRSPSIERNDNAEWRADIEGASDKERKTIATLDRLHANAMRMAENQELVARIEREKQELHEAIERASSVAPRNVISEARDVERMGEELSGVLKGERPKHRSLIEVLIREFLKAKEYILSKLRKWLGMQDRYGGNPLQPM
jgi:hypothetical protein